MVQHTAELFGSREDDAVLADRSIDVAMRVGTAHSRGRDGFIIPPTDKQKEVMEAIPGRQPRLSIDRYRHHRAPTAGEAARVAAVAEREPFELVCVRIHR